MRRLVGVKDCVPKDALSIAATVDDTARAPYSINLNFSVAREFRHGFLVEGSYVGRLSRRVLTQEDGSA